MGRMGLYRISRPRRWDATIMLRAFQWHEAPRDPSGYPSRDEVPRAEKFTWMFPRLGVFLRLSRVLHNLTPRNSMLTTSVPCAEPFYNCVYHLSVQHATHEASDQGLACGVIKRYAFLVGACLGTWVLVSL